MGTMRAADGVICERSFELLVQRCIAELEAREGFSARPAPHRPRQYAAPVDRRAPPTLTLVA